MVAHEGKWAGGLGGFESNVDVDVAKRRGRNRSMKLTRAVIKCGGCQQGDGQTDVSSKDNELL